ncbi:MAG: hypothetical protein IT305_29560 [Chloroflexi bacterium]|nr:hypothetical protein [Chloroflexota bacterium]
MAYGGVLIVPTIVGLVEAAKRLGLGGAYAAPLAVALGLMASVGYALASDVPGGTAVADAVVQGLALGLSAVGLYSGVRRGMGARDQGGPETEGLTPGARAIDGDSVTVWDPEEWDLEGPDLERRSRRT